MKLTAVVMRCPVSVKCPAVVNHPHRSEHPGRPLCLAGVTAPYRAVGPLPRAFTEQNYAHSVSQVSFSNTGFYLLRHTMRWPAIPDMLHLLLRSFPERLGAEKKNPDSALSFDFPSVSFSHSQCLLPWGGGGGVNVPKPRANGHNSLRC